MSLLEQARSQQQTKRLMVDLDDVELAVAWVRREVTTLQAANVSGVNPSNYPGRMGAALRRGFKVGVLTISFTPPVVTKDEAGQ